MKVYVIPRRDNLVATCSCDCAAVQSPIRVNDAIEVGTPARIVSRRKVKFAMHIKSENTVFESQAVDACEKVVNCTEVLGAERLHVVPLRTTCQVDQLNQEL